MSSTDSMSSALSTTTLRTVSSGPICAPRVAVVSVLRVSCSKTVSQCGCSAAGVTAGSVAGESVALSCARTRRLASVPIVGRASLDCAECPTVAPFRAERDADAVGLVPELVGGLFEQERIPIARRASDAHDCLRTVGGCAVGGRTSLAVVRSSRISSSCRSTAFRARRSLPTVSPPSVAASPNDFQPPRLGTSWIQIVGVAVSNYDISTQSPLAACVLFTRDIAIHVRK